MANVIVDGYLRLAYAIVNGSLIVSSSSSFKFVYFTAILFTTENRRQLGAPVRLVSLPIRCPSQVQKCGVGTRVTLF